MLALILAFGFIFTVAQSCVANQESTAVRKYVTGSDSILSDSSSAGKDLQPVLADSGGDPKKIDAEAVTRVADRSERLYRLARENEEVPPEFEGVHHYLVSSLGIRADATRRLANAVSSDAGNFNDTLAAAVEDYRISDSIVANHYIPASEKALRAAGQSTSQSLLNEPEPFMDYDALGFDQGSQSSGAPDRRDPNALHGVEVTAVEVAGQPLYPGGNVVLSGDDEPVFSVTVTNGGEVAETAVPVEVILNTSVERQSRKATIERIEPNGGTATVEIKGFRPGELDETAEVTVEAGPVKYENYLENNTLTGTVTFGL